MQSFFHPNVTFSTGVSLQIEDWKLHLLDMSGSANICPISPIMPLHKYAFEIPQKYLGNLMTVLAFKNFDPSTYNHWQIQSTIILLMLQIGMVMTLWPQSNSWLNVSILVERILSWDLIIALSYVIGHYYLLAGWEARLPDSVMFAKSMVY